MINKHTNTTSPYQYTVFFLFFSLYFIFLFFLLSLLSLPPFLFLSHTTAVLLSGKGNHRRFPLRSLFSQKRQRLEKEARILNPKSATVDDRETTLGEKGTITEDMFVSSVGVVRRRRQ